MADKRINEYPIVQSIAEDDYVLMESSQRGSYRILASELSGGGSGGGAGGDLASGYNINFEFPDLFTVSKQSYMNGEYDTTGDTPVYRITCSSSGSNIGFNLNGNKNLKRSGLKKIHFKITTGTAYSSTNPLIIGISSTVVSSYYNITESQASQYFTRYRVYDATTYANTTIEGELNIEGLTSDQYIVIVARGWNATITEFELSTEPYEIEYIVGDGTDGTLVVANMGSDNWFRWYWNFYDFTTTYMAIPSNLTKYVKNNVIVQCKLWETPFGFNYINIGFYSNSIRCWTYNLQANLTPTGVKCIMESTDSGSGTEYHEWVNPVIPTPLPTYLWLYNQAQTLVVRRNTVDCTFRIYWNSYNVQYTGYNNRIPDWMSKYGLAMDGVTAKVWVDDSADYDGQVGINTAYTALFYMDLTAYKTGVAKGIMESTDTGHDNEHEWEDPDIPVSGGD